MIKRAIQLLHQTFKEWNKDHVPRFGAALAFYSVFSLAPLLMIAISVSGFVFGHEAARGQVVDQLHGLMGKEAAEVIETVVSESAERPGGSAIAGLAGIATLLLGAFGVFGQLKDALNTIWDVPSRSKRGILQIVRDRFFSYLTVLGTGFLLLVSLIISAGLSAAAGRFSQNLVLSATWVRVIELAVSFAVSTMIFALIFKVLPDLSIAWNDVWIGAAITSILFTAGKSLIGIYIGHSSAKSAYGAAGSLVVLLLWVFYSAQILLFGAEFTHVYANRNTQSK